MRPRRLVALSSVAALSSLACGPAEWRPRVQVPTEIDRAAVLTFDAQDNFLWGSELGRVDDGSPLEVQVDFDGDPTYAVVVGFSLPALEPFGSATTSWPVRVAAPRDPYLPTPNFTGRLWLDRGAVELESPFEFTVPLTQDGLAPCPVVPNAQLGLSCAIEACDPQAVQDGCALTIDPKVTCSMGYFDLRLDARGQVVSVTSDRTDRCDPITPPAGASVAVRCGAPDQAVVDSCLVELGPGAVQRSFGLRTFRLFDAAPTEAPSAYFSGLVSTGEEVILAHQGRPESWLCTDPRPSKIALLDLDAGRVASERDGPPCLGPLVTAPEPGAFFGVFGTDTRFIGRFDGRGVLGTTSPVTDLRFVQHVARSGDRLVLLGSNGGLTGPFALVVFDLNTQTSTVIPIPLKEPTGLDVQDQTAVVLDDEDDAAYYYDLSRPTAAPRVVSLRIGAFELRGLHKALYWHAQRHNYVVPTGARLAGLTVFDDTGVLARPVPIGPRRSASAVIAVPDAPELLVATMGPVGTLPPSLALLDPSVPRFVQPPQALPGLPVTTFVAHGARMVGAVAEVPEILIIDP